MTVKIGIIGGSGLYKLADDSEVSGTESLTPFSSIPVTLYVSQLKDRSVAFLPRHGATHNIPPHRVNYRANLWALKENNVSAIFAVNVVGGISENMPPGTVVIPDQLIDYTWGREHTYHESFADDGEQSLPAAEKHVDFSWPYAEGLRQTLLASAGTLGFSVFNGGVYGCTQGPRLETAAEIKRMKRDGCSMVGMTGMPEAALARELDIPYASIALVVNWAAGLTDEPISFKAITGTLDKGMKTIRQIVLNSAENVLE